MASTIISRVIGGLTETAVQMANSSWARPITLPSTWSKVRVGMRLHFVASATLTGPRLLVGLGSGITSLVGDVTTPNFVGLIHSGNWVLAGGCYEQNTNAPFTKVGTVETTGALIDNSNVKFISAAAAATADRCLMFVDITKGSPNFTVDAFMSAVVGPADQSAATFLTQVQAAVPAVLNYSFGTNGAKTIAVNEAANGTLNTVCCAWNTSLSPLEICDLAVVLLA